MSLPPPIPGIDPAPGYKKPTNWWLMGCGGCLGFVVLGAVAGGLIFFGVMKTLRGTDAYRQALKAAQDSSALQEQIGTPITPSAIVLGAISVEDVDGQANLNFAIKGPKNGARVFYRGSKSHGTWQASRITATVDGTRKSIDLNTQADPWPPAPEPAH